MDGLRASAASSRTTGGEPRARSIVSKKNSRLRGASIGRHAATVNAGSRLKHEIDECDARLVALAASELPLSLLGDLLDGVKPRTSASGWRPRSKWSGRF